MKKKKKSKQWSSDIATILFANALFIEAETFLLRHIVGSIRGVVRNERRTWFMASV
jgi:hypothetical protein